MTRPEPTTLANDTARTAEMTHDVVLAFFNACNRRDLDEVASFFTDDATYLGSLGPHDDGTVYRGKDEVRRGMATFLMSHTSLRYDDLDIIVTGTRGFASWTFIGTRPTGETYRYRGVDLLEFSDHRIRRKDAFRKERLPTPSQ